MGTEDRKSKCYSMKILKAAYGGVDCTKHIQSKVINSNLIFTVNNDIIGDPDLGKIKYLVLEWEYEGKKYSDKYRENTQVCIQNTKTDKLGIFYSNNDRPETQATIKRALYTLQEASHDKADILTCMWEKQQDNPFTEYISWSKSYGHVNQVLQILQLLYNAKSIRKYKYVSFLEHDVLYPEGYFDYDAFEKGEVLCNMNYIGLCKNGWQKRVQDDSPFHQMTMHFTDALIHIEKVLENALLVGSGLVEPSNMKTVYWECNNPSAHVNHGYHYTSHFSIYSKDTYNVDNYWGDYSEYKNLF